jgi:GNAT superfamily N-acetyltransferase
MGVVTRADRTHAAALANIHASALPDDFLASLGTRFLQDVYWPATFESANGVNLMAVEDGRPVGFVTIAHDSAAFTRDVMRGRTAELAMSAIRAALRRPTQLIKSAEVLWSVLTSPRDPVDGEIVLIAVDQSHRGKGVGKMLVAAALDYLREQRVTQCRTKTLAANVGVIAMYENLGWHVRDRFRLIGREYVTIVSPVL